MADKHDSEDWEFGFAAVVALLSDIHEVSEVRQSAFANRLKNLQRAGFPKSTKTGRGIAAAYDIEAVLNLLLAVELLQLGFPPERVIKILSTNISTVLTAAKYAGEQLSHAIDEPTLNDISRDYFLLIDPVTLSDMTSLSVDGGRTITKMLTCTGASLPQVLAHRDSRWVLINTTAVIQAAANHFYNFHGRSRKSFGTALSNLAASQSVRPLGI